jgi:hypothetical protein
MKVAEKKRHGAICDRHTPPKKKLKETVFLLSSFIQVPLSV